MTQAEYKRLFLFAESIRRVNPDYFVGYRRGLRRAYFGEAFGSESEHQAMRRHHNADIRRGYEDGLAACEPSP